MSDTGTDNQGEGTAVPLVKFSGTPVVATPLDNGAAFHAAYEVVNMGTAPTTAQDEVWCSVMFQNAMVHQDKLNLDNPVVEANGGSHKGSVRFDGHYFKMAGDWEAWFSITNAANENADEATVPFKVEAAAHHDLEPPN